MSETSLPLTEKERETVSHPPQTDHEREHEQQPPSRDLLSPLEPIAAEFKPGRAFMLAFLSICFITLAAAIDATSLSIALPIIAEKLHGTAIEAFWAGTSFLITSAVFQPVIAGLSHVFGRKNVRNSTISSSYIEQSRVYTSYVNLSRV
jgi:hypothetical protein